VKQARAERWHWMLPRSDRRPYNSEVAKPITRRTALPLLLCGASRPLSAEDWPQFRGPDGQGHSGERALPLNWSENANVRWKVPIPGLGWSSPAILGDRIWVTTAMDRGRSLQAICLDRETGRQKLAVEVFHSAGEEAINGKNSYASPTPLLDGDHVYLHFGPYGTACIRNSGEVVWRTRLKYSPQHGPGGSPALFEDLLIVSCDGMDTQYVAALDTGNGKVRWKTPRAGQQAYATPLVIEAGGRTQLIAPGAFRATAYDPRTGKEIWWVSYGQGFSNVPRPVFGAGLVFICSGFFEPVLLAVRPDGRGDVTDSHVTWKLQRGAPLTPSPLLAEENLYVVTDNGIGTCLDARTGATHWRERLGGTFSASPVYADGRIYFLNEDGQTTVVAPSKQFQKLATNQLDGRTLASIAVSGGALFIRTDKNLYRLEKRT
jgi:outer membrane protein assembly factor BamB